MLIDFADVFYRQTRGLFCNLIYGRLFPCSECLVNIVVVYKYSYHALGNMYFKFFRVV